MCLKDLLLNDDFSYIARIRNALAEYHERLDAVAVTQKCIFIGSALDAVPFLSNMVYL